MLDRFPRNKIDLSDTLEEFGSQQADTDTLLLVAWIAIYISHQLGRVTNSWAQN